MNPIDQTPAWLIAAKVETESMPAVCDAATTGQANHARAQVRAEQVEALVLQLYHDLDGVPVPVARRAAERLIRDAGRLRAMLGQR